MKGRNSGNRLGGDESGDGAIELVDEEAFAADGEEVERAREEIGEGEGGGRCEGLQRDGLGRIDEGMLRNVRVDRVYGEIDDLLAVGMHHDASRIYNRNTPIQPQLVTCPITMQ